MEQKYTLNMIPGGMPLRIPVHQYDAGTRTLKFTLKAGAEAYSVPTGSTITIEGTKPDGHSFQYGASASGAVVTATVTQQMTACAGETAAQLTIRKNGTVLGSARFLLVVERNVLPEDADLSETELSGLQEAIQQSAASAAQASAYAEKTKALLASVPVISIGAVEPEGPAIWFDTSAGGDVTLQLSEDTGSSAVVAEVDGEEYGVSNTAVNQQPTAGQYSFDLI